MHLDLLIILIILIPILYQNQFLCPDPDNFDPADPDPNSLPDVMMMEVQLQSKLFS